MMPRPDYTPRALTPQEEAALTPAQIRRVYRSRSAKDFARIVKLFKDKPKKPKDKD
jgi:hypothetical protein